MLVLRPVLRDILENPALNLRRKTDFYDPELQLEGFSVSELPDPMDYWDKPGSILLTTALSLDYTSSSAMGEYVKRSLDAGVIAIGVSVGPHVLSEVPTRLVAEGDRQGLTVFEVPLSTRFVGVTQAIIDVMARAEYQSRLQALALQQKFARAALRQNGSQRIIVQLGEALDGGWAALLSPNGTVTAHSRPLRDDILETLQKELQRISSRGGQMASSFPVQTETVALYPVGLERSPTGYLAVGYTASLGEAERSLLATAVAILSLHQEGRQNESQLRRKARRERLLASLRSDPSTVGLLERVADLTPLTETPEHFAIVVATSPQEAGRTVERLEGDTVLSDCEIAELDERVVLTLANTRLETVVRRLRDYGMRIGVFEDCEVEELGSGYESALRAHEAARRLGKDMVRMDRGFGSSVLSFMPTAPLRMWADNSAAALERELGESAADEALAALGAYLRANGSLSAAATSLGIHRHTLRNHLLVLESALEVSLHDPETRATMWIALRALGRV